MKTILKNKLFISVAFFVMTLCVFGPLELFITNQSELWFGFYDALKIAGIMAAASAAILTGIGMLLKGKAYSIYTALIFIVTLCFYIQGNYLNISYGVLDGRTIDWSSYKNYAVVDTLFWVGSITILLLLWKKRNKLFDKVQQNVSYFVIVVQIISLGFLAISNNVLTVDKGKNYYLTDENIMEVGNKDNVVVFVLDAFDDALMDSLMETDGDRYHALFSDFVRFTDCAAGGATTAAAMPIIITGQDYSNGMSYFEYVDTAFDANGLYTELKKQKYSVNLYTESNFVGESAGRYVDNFVKGKNYIDSYAGITSKYGSFTMFKYMPHVLKRFFWIYTDEFSDYQSNSNYVINDAKFYETLNTEQLQIVGENSFHLFHLMGAHYPYTINEFAQYDEEATREQQAKGDLYIIEEYMNQMKSLGVYDNSMIIVTADHGDANNFAHSILFVKDRGRTGSYIENDAPVSHRDLPATLFDYLGKDAGDTFFEVSETDKRERKFYLRLQEAGTFYMQEYLIDGKLSSVGCGTPTGNKLAPKRENSAVVLGEKMTLGIDGTANEYIVSGLDVWPIDCVESIGTESEFSFDLGEKPSNDLVIELDILRIYNEELGQHITIYSNNKICYEEDLESGKVVCFTVPVELLDSESLNLRLVYRDKWCPIYLSGITISSAKDIAG